MSKIKIIKKIKANFIRFQLHRIFGPFATLFIYLGYLTRLSKWAYNNKKKLGINDFYNSKVVHADRFKLYQYVLEKESLKDSEFNYIEFGVGRGNSMKWWTENTTNPSSNFFGFDTFTGLPEDWGTYKAGTFSLGGNFPEIVKDQRVKFYKGLFQETLYGALTDIKFEKRNIIHLDGDMYSSALFPMAVMFPYLKTNDLILFDEFVVPMHEYRMYEDFLDSFPCKLEPIGAVNNYLQVAFRLVK